MRRVRAHAAELGVSAEGGRRTEYVFFDLAQPSDILAISEPLFHELDATVEFFPAMNGDDLGAGPGKASRAWT